ncbi:TPA: hypothetical protein ACWS11_002757 [Escherichia coli]
MNNKIEIGRIFDNLENIIIEHTNIEYDRYWDSVLVYQNEDGTPMINISAMFNFIDGSDISIEESFEFDKFYKMTEEEIAENLKSQLFEDGFYKYRDWS